MPSPKQIPQEILDLSPEAFSQWKHHPVTRAYLTWLAECRSLLTEQHLQRWAARQELPDGGESEARGQVELLEKLASPQLYHITSTYLPDHMLGEDGRIKSEEESNGE